MEKNRISLAGLCFVVVFFFLVLSLVGAARVGPDGGDEVKAGEQTFKQDCTSCHLLDAQDGRNYDSMIRSEGPSLSYAGEKFVPSWLEKWLVSPVRIRPAGYLSFRYVVVTPGGDRVEEARLTPHPSLLPTQAHEVAMFLLSLTKEPNQYPTSAGTTEIAGKILFEKVLGCGSCHQAEPGQGGLSGPELYTASRRLRKEWVKAFVMDPVYWGPSTMPKSSIRADQLEAIVSYLYEVRAERVAVNPPSAALPSRPRPDSQATKAWSSASRARMLYLVFCSQCHGVEGDGNGINAPRISVAPRNHTSYEEMKGLTDDRLFAAIKFGGPAVGKSMLMPSWAAILKDSDINLLVAYLRKLSGTEGAVNRFQAPQPALSWVLSK